MRHMVCVLHVSVQAAQLILSDHIVQNGRHKGHARHTESGKASCSPLTGRAACGELWHQCQNWIHMH